MKRFSGILSCLILVLACGLLLSSCGKGGNELKLTATESEIELVLGTETQTRTVEFVLENYGKGSSQLNFSVEEEFKTIVSFKSESKSNGKTILSVTGLSRGTAKIVATSLQGSQRWVLTVKVVQPISSISLKTDYKNSLYAITGKTLNLAQEQIWNFLPSTTNQRQLNFSVIGNSKGVQIENGVLKVDEACALSSVSINVVSAFNENVSTEIVVKILNPLSISMIIDGKTIVDDGTTNYVEIFPTELAGSEFPNSKEITLVVKGASSNNNLLVEPILGSDEEKFEIVQTASSFDSSTKSSIYKFLLQSKSTSAGKIDWAQFVVSYKDLKAGENEYRETSTKLNISSFNKPLTVEVNGENVKTNIDVFENNFEIADGKTIKFSVLPGDVKLNERTITIWADNFSSLPVSLYKLNSTRTGYICVFGYDQSGNPVGAIKNGVRYLEISSETTLYAFVNAKYDSTLNKTAKIFAQASCYCSFVSTGKALTEINFVVNPSSKSISLATKEDGKFVVSASKTIFAEVGQSTVCYVAIDPNNFTLGSSSFAKILNENLGTVGTLEQVSVDDKYVYGRFTITANKVGATKVSITLADGKSQEFNLEIISPLESLSIDLENLGEIESDIITYKNIPHKNLSVGDESPYVALNKLSIANSGGSGIQLVKTPSPSSAQYYLNYKFVDLETIPSGKTIKTVGLADFDLEAMSFSDSSSLINTTRLKNLSIIEAINSSIEGNVLIKIDVHAMQENGEFTDESVGSFYYLVNFFVPIGNMSLSNATLELNSYQSVGDKLISQSTGSFTVEIKSVNSGLEPTYVKNLILTVNNGKAVLDWEKFEKNGNVINLNVSGEIVTADEAVIQINKTFQNNCYTFGIKALKGEANYIFALTLHEVEETKQFSSIARVIVKKAIEIEEIEVVNASENDPLSFNNPVSVRGEDESYDEIIENVIEQELIINLRGENGKDITNSSLEFEFEWEELSTGKAYYYDENGNKVSFVQIVEEEGKYTLRILRGAYDYSKYFAKTEAEKKLLDKEDLKEFVGFFGKGKLKIYPTSNYFALTNGWNGENPIVVIPVEIKDSYSLYSEEDLELLKKFPEGKFEIKTDIHTTLEFKTIESFSGTLDGNGKTIYLSKPLFESVNTTSTISNLNISFDGRATASDAFGSLTKFNYGTIKNVNAKVNIVALENSENLEEKDISEVSKIGSIAEFVGGIVGQNSGTVSGAKVSGTIVGQNVGGIVGKNNGEIKESICEDVEIRATQSAGGISASSTSEIKGSKIFNAKLTIYVLSKEQYGEIATFALGGIVGQNSGNISLSKAEETTLNAIYPVSKGTDGIEEKTIYAGGIVGISTSSEGTKFVEKSFFIGKIENENLSSGGLVGQLQETKIENSYSKVEFGKNSKGGQFVFEGELAKIENCYVSSNKSYFASNNETSFETNKTTSSFIKAQEAEKDETNCGKYSLPASSEDMVGWDFEEIWNWNVGKLPTLRENIEPPIVSDFEFSLKGDTNNNWLVNNKDEKFAILFKWDALASQLTQDQKATLDKLNEISLSDLIDVKEYNLNSFKISSDTNVVEILNDKIKVVGTGKATITIKAKSGSGERAFDVYVINPIGEILIENNGSEVNDTLTIYNNNATYLDFSTKNTFSLNGETFAFRQSAFGFAISAFESGGTDNSFTISGIMAQEDLFTQGVVSVCSSVDGIYSLVVIAKLQNGAFEFCDGAIEKINTLISNKRTKKVSTTVSSKAQRILISADEAEVDPSGVLNFDFVLETTKIVDTIVLTIKDEAENIVWASKDICGSDEKKIYEMKDNKTFVVSGYNGTKGSILIGINDESKAKITSNQTYKVVLSDSERTIEKEISLKVVPQKILSATYVHHSRTDDSTETGLKIQSEPSSILMPGDCGLLTIGLYPTYSNFTKIEIESEIVDGNNFVYLEQMYKSGEFFLPASSTIGYSNIRDENKLTIYKPDNSFDGEIFVRTKVLSSVIEGVYFPLNIKIYDGEEIVKSERITLVSENIDSARITINGKKEAIVARGSSYPIEVSVPEGQSLADCSISNYQRSNDNQDFISLYFDESQYVVEDGRKIYSGTLTIGLNAELNADGIFNVDSKVNKIINGRLETISDSIEVSIVDFLIEEIKIKGNAEGDNVFNAPVAIGKDLEFEIVLSETPEAVSESQKLAVERINSVKESFMNNFALKQYIKNDELIYQYIINTGRNFTISGSGETTFTPDERTSVAYNLFYADGELTPFVSNKGVVQENNIFQIKFNNESALGLSPTQLHIVAKQVGAKTMQIRIPYRAPGRTEDLYVTYNFVLNAQVYSDEDKPTPIDNENQFLEYLSSETEQYDSTNFILMEDIVLENFTPFKSTNFASLDGNNKVITIKNFVIPTSGSVSLALFSSISKGSTVKNLTINVGELETIKVGSGVTALNVAGLAINNYGIVYNCEVVCLDIETSVAPLDGGIKIEFETEKQSLISSSTIAGLVINNGSQATITNSRVGGKGSFVKVGYENEKTTTKNIEFGLITISGKGNISGFVSTNNGTISASYFANGTIVNKTTSSYEKVTAGFVKTNSGEIHASFAEGIKLGTDLSFFHTGGGIIAQGVSAGFVYENDKTITDSYANIKLVGEGTGRIVSGFVYSNNKTATIERCYSASTIEGSLTIQMPFTGLNVRNECLQYNPSGLTNCYYIVDNNKKVDNLEDVYKTGAISIDYTNLSESSFYSFAVSTKDGNGVWNVEAKDDTIAELPQLVTANDKAISVRRIIKNYNSLISGGVSIETLNIFPYISGYEYGTKANPIIIRTADEFNRVFGNEKGLISNAYYEISKRYDKNKGLVFGNYRLVSSIDFTNLSTVDSVKISSSVMNLTQQGSFDGNGLAIDNVEISFDSQVSVGLFSQITSGSVFKNVNITVSGVASKNGVYAGAVAGYVSDSALTNIAVKPVTEKGEERSSISGQSIVGGIAGAVVGNSSVSNLTSSISVVSGNKNANKDNIEEYILRILRNSKVASGTIISDKNKEYSFAGGVIGILDIYEELGTSYVPSSPNAKKLTFTGNEVSVQGSYVGGVVGFVGINTFLDDSAFILTGGETSLGQRLISYSNTIGGVVGVSQGKLLEIRIEHEDSLQEKIENNLETYYSSSSNVFRGNTKLFNSDASSDSSKLKSIGGLVGQMLAGELSVSYSKIDVSNRSAEYAGGLVGLNQSNSNFFEVYAFGDVDGEIVGGLVGKNEGKIVFDNSVAINFFSKTNSHFETAIEKAKKNDNKTANLENLYGLVGENDTGKDAKLTIGISVYAKNTYENFSNGLKIVLDAYNGGKIDSSSISKLTIDPSNYQGYDRNAQVINKMFLTAGWDPLSWELKDNRYLPTFNYGIAEKVLYIEKPIDFLKLKKYYKGDNVVIFGDDPTTSFNPYNYVSDNEATYGDFEGKDMKGLSVDIEKKTITFDISEIEPGESTSYFKYFRGTMRTELGSWTYVITGIKRALFNSIYGGKIGGLTFGESDKEKTTEILANGVLSNGADGSAEFENLTFRNIILTAPNNLQTGIVSGVMNNIYKLTNITVENCKIKVNKNLQSAIVGGIAGTLDAFDVQEAQITNVKVSGLTIDLSGESLKFQKIGGLFGHSSGTFVFKGLNLEKISLKSVLGNENLEAKIGGIAGHAQGSNKLDQLDKISDITITVYGKGKSASASLLFGEVRSLELKVDESETFSPSGAIAIHDCSKITDQLNVGGFAGKSLSSLDIQNCNLNVEIKANEEDSKLSKGLNNFGAFVGYSSGSVSVSTKKGINPTISVKSDREEELLSEGELLSIGGIVGTATLAQNKASISNAEFNGTIETSVNIKQYVGGVVGSTANVTNVSGKSEKETITIENATFSGTINILKTGGEFYVGGIVGSASDESSKVEIYGVKAKGTINLNGTNDALNGITAYVGGIVGSAKNATIGKKDGKNAIETAINFNPKTLTGSTLYAGGVAGSLSGETNLSCNYAWGNITLKNAKMINKEGSVEEKDLKYDISALYIGGLVGSLNSATLKNNYCLTSLYVTRRAETTMLGALVGSQSGTSSDSGNFYCHQMNLATDTLGTNLYYKNGKVNGTDPILNLFTKAFSSGELGTKLNPDSLKSTSFDNSGYSYFYISSKTSASSAGFGTISENQHVVGDGNVISSSVTPFAEIKGALSGVKIELKSGAIGTGSGGRADLSDWPNTYGNNEKLPNGVVGKNSGVVFAVIVYATGGKEENGGIRYSINAGIARFNSGKISDCGVVLNVKSAFAGIASVNNSSNAEISGLIENSYVTGAVHEGSQYAIADSQKSPKSAVENSYCAIKATNVLFKAGSSTLCNNIYVDTIALGTTGTTANNVNYQTTDYMSTATVTQSEIKLSGSIWKQDASINFGYPYHGNGAYLGLGLKTNTINKIPNAGKLKQVMENNKRADLLCDIDLKTISDLENWTAIEKYTADLYGHGYVIENISLKSGSAFINNLCGSINDVGLIYNGGNVEAGVAVTNNGTINTVYSSGAKTAKVGGLVGTNNGNILKSQNHNTVSGNVAGGIAGTNSVSGAIYDSCSNYGEVSGNVAGGIVGTNSGETNNETIKYGTIKYVYNYGTVTATDGTAGGIVGTNSGKIGYSTKDSCSNYGTVSGNVAGGIVGTNSGGKITYANNYGSVSGNVAGGIVGDYGTTTKLDASEKTNGGVLKPKGQNFYYAYGRTTENGVTTDNEVNGKDLSNGELGYPWYHLPLYSDDYFEYYLGIKFYRDGSKGSYFAFRFEGQIGNSTKFVDNDNSYFVEMIDPAVKINKLEDIWTKQYTGKNGEWKCEAEANTAGNWVVPASKMLYKVTFKSQYSNEIEKEIVTGREVTGAEFGINMELLINESGNSKPFKLTISTPFHFTFNMDESLGKTLSVENCVNYSSSVTGTYSGGVIGKIQGTNASFTINGTSSSSGSSADANDWANFTSEIEGTDGVYNVYDAGELAWIMAKGLKVETINVMNDLNLSAHKWSWETIGKNTISYEIKSSEMVPDSVDTSGNGATYTYGVEFNNVTFQISYISGAYGKNLKVYKVVDVEGAEPKLNLVAERSNDFLTDNWEATFKLDGVDYCLKRLGTRGETIGESSTVHTVSVLQLSYKTTINYNTNGYKIYGTGGKEIFKTS